MIAILIISIAFQLVAVFFAIRLIFVTGRYFSWILIATAITLMAVRRLISLISLIKSDSVAVGASSAEYVALVISILISTGIILIEPVFKRIKNKEKELEVKNEKLREVNATKDKFFSIIGHDLKNPFNSILGMSQLLSRNVDKYSPEKIRHMAEQMHHSSKNAYHLLENLLKWAKIQRGELQPKKDKTDPVEMIREVEALCRPTADSKNIHLKSASESSAPVLADREMVKTVLRNLITNALKYTFPDGFVHVTTTKSGHQLQFTVSDTGTGIAPEHLEHLFDIDCALSKEGTAREKGTGLGLILSKEFIEKHGGSIWVESEVDKGSDFHFTLPLWNG